MKELIFEEMRRKNMGIGYAWKFQEYHLFLETLNPVQKQEFTPTMEQLVNDGLFSKKQDGPVVLYFLTEKGVQEIYR